MNENLGRAALQALKENFFATVLVDRTNLERRELKGGQLLAVAMTLAEKLSTLPEKRIGIVLPPGAGGWIANIAVALAGKSSVNLNFTTPRETAVKALEMSGVKTIITAAAMRERAKDFPWEAVAQENLWDLKEILIEAKDKGEITKKYLQALLLPTAVLQWLWRVPTDNKDREEATLLFSSGSTGTPKGIPLTHGNILGNLRQIEEVGIFTRNRKVLANLPLFHSFGLTVTLWYTLTRGVPVATTPNPLDCEAIGRVAEEEKVNVLVGTASFFRLYIKQIRKEKFQSLKFVVAGAEKTPKGLHQRWKEAFGSDYLEGYGLTETSPVVSVNTPNENRIGTVGRPMKGIEVRISDPATGGILNEMGAKGILEFKGPNIFGGYLNDPKLNAEVLREGWLWTGDLGWVDKEGYITVEGRLKRFSKIAGEMVPHGAVEEALLHALGWHEEVPYPLAVTGAPDTQKGEHLVVVTTRALHHQEVMEKLHAAGLPNLWIPKKIIEVAALPYMPNGKLDLARLAEMGKMARGA